MVSIFISHSRKDKDLLAFFDRIFAGVEVKAIREEFEKYHLPPWKKIEEDIRFSSALFVLLGPNAVSSSAPPYTSNWISYEIGLAHGSTEPVKPIWVFEQFDKPIDFPIPYLDHYMLIDPNSDDHFHYIKKVVQAYTQWFRESMPKGFKKITCPYSECGITFTLHTVIDQFKCPSCRQVMVITPSEK